jgi:hypothetical protein
MKIFRNRIGATGRPRGFRARIGSASSGASGSHGFEPLEIRTLLTASPLTDEVACYDSADQSIRCLLASSIATDASEASAAATTLTSMADTTGDDGGGQVVAPLADENDIVSFILEVRTLDDQPLPNNVIGVGEKFKLVVIVDDIRDPEPQFAGVTAAYMNLSFNGAVGSLVEADGINYNSYFEAARSGAFTPTAGQGVQLTEVGAWNGGDFDAPGGAARELFSVNVIANAIGELNFTTSFDSKAGNDTLLALLDSAVASDQIDFGTAQVNIVSNAVPEITINDVTAAEGTNAQDTPFVFMVSLSEETSSTVTVAFQTSAGSATLGSDFNGTNGTLTFEPGDSQKFITVLVEGDPLDEDDNETFTVTLSNATGGTLDDPIGVGTIQDDDATPVLSIDSVSQLEGDEGTTNFVFTVSLSAPSGRNVTVDFDAIGEAIPEVSDPAIAGEDFAATSGTLTFTPLEISKTITVAVQGDTDREPNESFRVALSNLQGATLSTAPDQGVGMIQNDDGPRITLSPLTIANLEGDEGTTPYVFTIDIGAEDDEDVTVLFETIDGTATADDDDFVAQSGTLTFEPGETQKSVTVLVNGDTVGEANETFMVLLSNATNATLVNDSATATITNDDDVTISFADDSLSATEPDASQTTQLVYTVNLSGDSQATVTVQFDLLPGTNAIPGTDYVDTSGTLTFVPGDTSETITVTVNGDALSEVDEQFTVRLFNSTNASNAQDLANAVTATGTIEDNDPLPSLSFGPPVVTHDEGDSGTTEYVFTATLSQASGQEVLVAFETNDAFNAVAGQDYTAVSGTLTFAPGETQKTITVLATGDTVFELAESFSVNLTAIGESVTLVDTEATGIISNDDALPVLSINNVSQVEGNSGTTDYVFTVTLSGATSETAVVSFATAPVTASTGSDFVGQAGTLTFAPTDTQKTITVTVNGDTLNETDETFRVNLSNADNASISSGQGFGTGTIQNDDGLPTLSIADLSQVEGDSGTTDFVFTVTLSALSGQTVTVGFSTALGTASAGDFTSTSGTVTFGIGTTTQTITVKVLGDLFQEPDETFLVNLANPVNATIVDGQATGTIQNGNDTLVVIPSSLSGFAFIDSDKDGVKDPGEIVLPNTTVHLFGTSSTNPGQTLETSTTTDATGFYKFEGLNPGTYEVEYELPAALANLFATTRAYVGSQGGTLSNTLDGFTSVISSPGDVDGVNNLYTVAGLKAEVISQRLYLASTDFDLSDLIGESAAPSTALALAAAETAGFSQNGSVVTVQGTAGDDSFAFTAGTMHTVTLNGETRQFDPAVVADIIFEGGGGSDTANVVGSSGADTANLGLGSGTFQGLNFSLTLANVSSIVVNGSGGADSATLTDSAFDDELSAAGNEATLANDLGQITTLLAFEQVKAITVNGGSDTADVDAIDFTLEQEGAWIAA